MNTIQRLTQNRKTNMREQIYQLLRTRMKNGEYSYSDRLVDNEIAQQLQVSRMPVREALLQLKNEGYLESTARGFVLRQFSPSDITDIFEVRILLEAAAAFSACKNVSLEGLSKMRLALDQATMCHKTNDVLGFLKENWDFRNAWLGMSPNVHLGATIDRLRDHAELARFSAFCNPKNRLSSIACIRDILEAFLRGDADAAQQAVLYNLRVCAGMYYSEQRTLLSNAAGDSRAP